MLQLCGGPGLQLKKKNSYFDMRWPETMIWWQETWFYSVDVPDPTGTEGLPPYTAGPAVKQPWWSTKVTKKDMPELNVLTKRIDRHGTEMCGGENRRTPIYLGFLGQKINIGIKRRCNRIPGRPTAPPHAPWPRGGCGPPPASVSDPRKLLDEN